MGTRKRSRGGNLISSDSQGELEDEGHIQKMDGVESGKGGEHSTKITDKERNESATKCNFERTCQVCDKKFETDSKLEQHCCSHFTKELEDEFGYLMDGLECTMCRKNFKSKATLVLHIGSKHGKINDILVKKNFDALPCPVAQGSTCSTPAAMQKQLIQLKNEKRSVDLMNPLTIATPEQINRRILDQEQHPTTSSSTMEERQQELLTPSSIPIKEEQEMENVDRIMRKMSSGQVTPVPPTCAPLAPSCEGQVPPVPSTSQQIVSVVTDTQAVYAPIQLDLTRSSTNIKDRSQSLPLVVELDESPPRQACPSSPPTSVDSKQPLDLTISSTTVKDRSQSTPQLSSQSLPPVVELDESPPHQACLCSAPTSVGSKQTLDLTISSTTVKDRSQSMHQFSSQSLPPVVELDESPPHQAHNFSPPTLLDSKQFSLEVPGTNVTKCTSSSDWEESLPLQQPGEGRGGKRLVQFMLTEVEVTVLGALGFKEY